MAKRRAQRKKARGSTRKPGGDVSSAPNRAERQSAYTLPSDAIESALLTGEHRNMLAAYFGEEQLRQLQELARQASSRSVRGGTRVLILPGIMGSKLGYPGDWWDDTIWIDPLDIRNGNLALLATDDPNSDKIKALGVLHYTYLQMKLRLKISGFNADFHPFDWRLSLETLGRQLKQRILEETQHSRQGSYVYLVAHSMGGLVSRSAMGQLAQDGDSASARVRRLVMLGTPNFGSFAPVQALRGEYPLVRKVAWIDKKHSPQDLAEKVFRTLPGLCQMLPFRERFSGVDLYDARNWPQSETLPPPPRQADLSAARPVQESLPLEDSRFYLIAGVDQETITGLRIKSSGDFEYLSSRAGDGTVPLDFARIDNVETWYVREAHGSLPNNQSVIRATIDLLDNGTTDELPKSWEPSHRDRQERVWEPPEFESEMRGLDTDPAPGDIRNLLSDVAAPMAPTPATAPAVRTQSHTSELSGQPIVIARRKQHRIDVLLGRGDVTQVGARAVILGVFNDVEPSGAAKAFDERLDFAITEFTERRMFSGNTGEVFIMPASRHLTRAELIVFVGMGAFDSFSNDVIAMVAENAARTLVRTGVNDIATVLLGGNSAAGLRDGLASLVRGFLSGIRDADVEHRMRSVTICEHNPERFELMRSELLHLATTPLFDDVEITVESYDLPQAPELPASVRARPTEKEPCYLFVRRQSETFSAPGAESDGEGGANEPCIFQSSVLTPSGKATVVTDSQEVDPAAIKQLLDEISKRSFNFDSLEGTGGFGTRLAEMLLPESIRHVLLTVQDSQLIVIHDAMASRIPWETMCLGGDWFPAARAGLFRKYAAENLSVAKWLESRRHERILNMLLVVNPTLDLAGAEAEGNDIEELLGREGLVEITKLHGRDATWNALYTELKSGKYDVVHYAGHAFFDPVERSRSGLICHGHRVLSGADLAGIGGLPSLAFFNACEAGRVRRGGAELPTQSTPQQRTEPEKRIEANVSLAEAFLRGGIANYVGTYWPVGDAAALDFAQSFYQSLLAGETISEGMQKGRRAVRDLRSVDWADYVLYGSPRFRLKQR